MARYIDADSTIKAIRNRFNIHFAVPCDAEDRYVQEIFGKVKKVIQEQPTADVVPKSEVEELIAEFDKMVDLISAMTGLNILAYGGKFAELKKKYTEEQI